MSAPLIVIPGRRSDEAQGQRTPVVSGGRFYADAVQRAGGLPVVVPPTDNHDLIRATVDRCDGMVLLGGGDVSPTSYGHTERARLYGVNEFIDEFEIVALRRAIERDIPILAICRGHQILNVALGGTLIQHLETTPDHRDTMHDVQLVPGCRVSRAMGTHEPLVHSFHHQAIDELAADLAVVGTFHDGTIEAVEHTTATWVVGVQWHPEDTAADDPHNQGLFSELVAQAAQEL
jgi:putative glutamine amidotransferase